MRTNQTKPGLTRQPDMNNKYKKGVDFMSWYLDIVQKQLNKEMRLLTNYITTVNRLNTNIKIEKESIYPSPKTVATLEALKFGYNTKLRHAEQKVGMLMRHLPQETPVKKLN